MDSLGGGCLIQVKSVTFLLEKTARSAVHSIYKDNCGSKPYPAGTQTFGRGGEVRGTKTRGRD